MLTATHYKALVFIALVLLALAFVLAGGVHAQDAVVATPTRPTSVALGSLYDSLVPYILTALSALVAAILAWVSAAFTKWTGIKIEANHREALHSAAMSGVTAALTRFRKTAQEARFETNSPVVASALEWVMTSVPDAVAALGISEESIRKLIESKISLLAEQPSATAVAQANAV